VNDPSLCNQQYRVRCWAGGLQFHGVAHQPTPKCLAAALKSPPFCSGSFRILQSHLSQASIRTKLDQSQSILVAEQLTVSKDQRIALGFGLGRMGVQKLVGHGVVCV